jgi:23S rRNA (uracil1939-C5)-methyltransferase
VEITEIKKKFARARLVRVVESSPRRVAPPCRYFGECGGCQYQHIDYALQLEIKGKQVGDLFERVGGFAREVVRISLSPGDFIWDPALQSGFPREEYWFLYGKLRS